ncbi:MAG: hypothetical protein ACHQNV_02770 [Vicinamibacteria bacterium]
MSGGRGIGVACLSSVLLLGLNAAFVSATVGFVHKPRKVLETDHYRYIDMAEAPPGRALTPRGREAPFCYRVLAPGIVWLLGRAGVSVNDGFYVVTNVFLFLFLVTLHYLLRHEGATAIEALLGVALVALVPGAVRWYEYQYWMPDPACLFFVTLALLLIRTGKEMELLLLSVVAPLARETYVLVLPVAFLHAWRTTSLGQAFTRTARLGAVTLGVLGALRMAIEPSEGAGLLAAAGEMIQFRARHLFEGQLYAATLGTFGLLFCLWWLRPERLVTFARRRPEDVAFVAAAYLSLAFANNTDRLLAYALPVVVCAALVGLRSIAASGLSWGAAAATALALQLFAYMETPFHEPGISVYPATQWAVVAALAAFWLTARLLMRAGARGA